LPKRLAALRRQISPHFLFNTLRAISALAMRGDQPTIQNPLWHQRMGLGR
jgi:sensor histidine kinase YesM